MPAAGLVPLEISADTGSATRTLRPENTRGDNGSPFRIRIHNPADNGPLEILGPLNASSSLFRRSIDCQMLGRYPSIGKIIPCLAWIYVMCATDDCRTPATLKPLVRPRAVNSTAAGF
jgi:hypothetical protein